MSRHDSDDTHGPWSYFLPITLAILVGVLGADGIRWALRVVLADRALLQTAAPVLPEPRLVRPVSEPLPAILPAPKSPALEPTPAESSTLPTSSANDAATSSTGSATDAADLAIAPAPTPIAASPSPSEAAPASASGAAQPADATLPSTIDTPDRHRQSDAGAESAAAVSIDPDAERLPGPVAARRDGASRACIGGTVAARSDNGWQQELSSDRPVRCVQSMP